MTSSSTRSAESVTRSVPERSRLKPPFFHSLRWRVIAWYGGVLALFMLAFAGAVYAGARNLLLASVAERVHGVAVQIENFAVAGAAGPFGPVAPITALGDQAVLDSFTGPGVYIEAYNQRGFPIGKSTSLGSADLPQTGYSPWRATADPGAGWGIAKTDVGVVLTRWTSIRLGGAPVATLYVAESLDNVQRLLGAFGAFLLAVLGLAFSVIVIASLWLARAAINPINDITRAAREISGEDLDKRLNWQGRRDELGALAATFDDMLARLEAAFARERRFIADASHELKTPLTVINANAQMLERWADKDDAIRREALDAIASESATMARVINAMLTLAKTDNAAALSFEPVELRRLMLEVAGALRSAAARKGIELRADCTGEAWVSGERGLLRQLFVNLAENAIKFTQAGSVTLALAQSNGKAHAEVRDTGSGIPPEAQAHVFDRFYRADPARSRHVEGTGLGLAVVRNIVRAHGGSIEIASQVGQGTTFTIDLPQTKPPD